MYKFFLAGVFLVLFFSFSAAPRTAVADEYYINPVSIVVNSSDNETFSFALTEKGRYKVFGIGGSRPRLVVDFFDGIYRGSRKEQCVNSNLAIAVRSAVHHKPVKKTRVVIDLQPDRKIGHTVTFDDEKQSLNRVLVSDEKALAAEDSKKAKEKKKEDSIAAVGEQGQVDQTKNDVEQISSIPKIQSISFNGSKQGEDKMIVRLNGFYPPKVSAREEGDSPQVYCDFLNAKMLEGVEKEIVTDGSYIQRITAQYLPERSLVRVTLDLIDQKNLDLQQIFLDEQLFIVVVRELEEETGPQ